MSDTKEAVARLLAVGRAIVTDINDGIRPEWDALHALRDAVLALTGHATDTPATPTPTPAGTADLSPAVSPSEAELAEGAPPAPAPAQQEETESVPPPETEAIPDLIEPGAGDAPAPEEES